MAQAKPQFSAEQILEAGRRAEAQGQIDYAIQFYRHLTDHHATAPEAQIAREALARLGPGRAAAAATESKAPAPAGAPPAAMGRPYRNGAAQPLAPGTGEAVAAGGPVAAVAAPTSGPASGSFPAQASGPGAAPGLAGRPSGPAPDHLPGAGPSMSRIDLRLAPTAERRPEARPGARLEPRPDPRRDAGPPLPPPAVPVAASPAPHMQPVALPDPVHGYRISRFLAGLVSFMGVVQLVGGGVATVLWLAATLRLAGTDQIPEIALAAGPYAISFVIAGAVTVVLGQALKAIFDTANASRELVAIARAVASSGQDDG